MRCKPENGEQASGKSSKDKAVKVQVPKLPKSKPIKKDISGGVRASKSPRGSIRTSTLMSSESTKSKG